MKKHFESLNTGDVNLAAALMSMGIPLTEGDPCSLVLRDDGTSYARFHVNKLSIKGDKRTDVLMRFWKSPKSCHDPAFSDIMNFVRLGLDRGARRCLEWLDLAHDYISDMSGGKVNMPTKIKDIPDIINTNPDASHAYILAYVYNRNHLWDIVGTARRRIMITRGDNHAMIDGHLEKWKRNEILARLED